MKSKEFKDRRNTILLIMVIVGLILTGAWKLWTNYRNEEVARSKFITEIEDNMKDVYKDEDAIKYGLSDVKYEIINISKVKKSYEISINLKCKTTKNLTDTEKSLLAYAVEDYVPNEFKDSNGYEITVRDSKNGFYEMINTSVNGEIIHSSREKYENINNSKITEEEKGNAVAIAQTEIKEKLKSPSSAKFPWGFDEYTITKSGKTFIVKSYVEAKNSFGTLLKINYLIKFTMTGYETYTVDSIVIDE